MSRADSPDFVESIERGLEVIRALGAADGEGLTLTRVAADTNLPRPTARRVLVTLEALGYVAEHERRFRLTPRVLDLGCAYIDSLGLWELARPRLAALVAATGESSSVAQLDGAEIVYVARVAVPKIVSIAVAVGTRFPAAATSMGRVLLAALPASERRAALAAAPRGPHRAVRTPSGRELERLLAETRERGWAIADQELAPGVRSVAVPLHDAEERTIAAVNVCVHAGEHSLEELRRRFLPPLRETAAEIDAETVAASRMPRLLVGG